MTVHVISVGLSVLDAFRDPQAKLAGKSDLVTAIRRQSPQALFAAEGIDDTRYDAASDWLAGALAAEGEPGRDPEKIRRLDEIAAMVRPEQWPAHFSAEIETLARVPGARRPLPAADIAVLICSDTPRGLLAGVWNALALTGGPARVRYLPDPGRRPGQVRGRAVLVRVPGMDAGSPEGFRQAMGGLGLLARHLFASGELAKAEPFRFYLSGGFKAAIPYLIGLAEAVRSIDAKALHELGAGQLMPDDGPYPVEAFVLHETAGPGAPPIRLPLRRLIASAVRQELTGYDKSRRRRGKPSPALLDGYAYEVTGRPGREICELTAFGEGLRELFGVTDEAYGG